MRPPAPVAPPPAPPVVMPTPPPAPPALMGQQPPVPQAPSRAQQMLEEAMGDRSGYAAKAPWLALANAGFATAAGQSPHALSNIGQGGMAGMQFYDRAMQQDAVERMKQAALALQLENAEEGKRKSRVEEGQGERKLGILGRTADVGEKKEAREAGRESGELDYIASGAELRRAQADYYRENKGKENLLKEADAAADREAKAEAMDKVFGRADPAKYQALLPEKKIAAYRARGLPLTPELKMHALASAKAAIAKGASREAVMSRLRQLGIEEDAE